MPRPLRPWAGQRETWPPGALADCTPANPTLQECGAAPAIAGISHWLNTPGDRPLTLAGLRGRVVLVDFWTYSCINCQRTLPHVEAWNRAYAEDGLTVVGVHTPEFAFEHVRRQRGPGGRPAGCALPDRHGQRLHTWNAYQNEYWPAEYLIDATGHVRHVDFGEGEYGQTESFIRQLLVAADPRWCSRRRTDVADRTPNEETTPETYLGYQHGDRGPGGPDGRRGHDVDLPGTLVAAPRTATPTAGTGRSAARRSTAGTGGAPSTSTSRPRTSTWSSAGRAPSRSRSTASPPAR